MKVDLEFAELHAPLFLGGKNHQMKLTAGERSGLKLIYDRAEKELHVLWGVHEAILPMSTVLSMCPKKESPVAPVAALAKSPLEREQVTAQVSTPTDHVFAGPGKGKSR